MLEFFNNSVVVFMGTAFAIFPLLTIFTISVLVVKALLFVIRKIFRIKNVYVLGFNLESRTSVIIGATCLTLALIISMYISLSLFRGVGSPPPIRTTMKEVQGGNYAIPIEYCTKEFLSFKNKEIMSAPSTKLPIIQVVIGDAPNYYKVYITGRSPYLSMDTKGYRESIRFTILATRNFDDPTKVEGYIATDAATQTAWPDNDQEVDSLKFTPFTSEQGDGLELFVRRYAKFLGECVGGAGK